MDDGDRTTATVEALAADPRYRALVAARGRYAWRLTGAMLAAYFGFILLVAFGGSLLAMPVGRGVTSLGIPLGLGVIVLAILLTLLYVRRANGVWDAEMAAIVAEHRA